MIFTERQAMPVALHHCLGHLPRWPTVASHASHMITMPSCVLAPTRGPIPTAGLSRGPGC